MLLTGNYGVCRKILPKYPPWCAIDFHYLRSDAGHRFSRYRYTGLFMCLAILQLFAPDHLTTPLYAMEPESGQRSATIDDIRVMIDVSGSMKKNDPNNLRASALQLFVTLLPPKTTSGIWIFDQDVKVLVPHQSVDKRWKDQARQALSGIHSRGLFTDIEETIKRATWDWSSADTDARRSLILLTDGLVDISKDQKKNNLSRARILNDLLPQLQNAKVIIHTVALSGAADESLLQQLAAATGGWYEKIESAEKLEKHFLRMFEKSARADTLPIKDNRVQVDASIKEITFLIFRKDISSTANLITPGGVTVHLNSSLEGMHWFHEKRYDLITINDPEPGYWRIEAQLDTDSRVLVITDLKLKNTLLPNNMAAYESYPFTVRLEQNEQVIKDWNLLQFVQFTLLQRREQQAHIQWEFNDAGTDGDSTANDGIFTTILNKNLTSGRHEFMIFVDGKTFQREHRRLVNIYDYPVVAKITRPHPDNPHNFTLSVIPYMGLIDFASMSVGALLTGPSATERKLEIPRLTPAEWGKKFDITTNPGRYRLVLHITGVTPHGRTIDMGLKPIEFGDELKASAGQVIDAIPDPQAAVATEETSPPKIEWLNITIYLIMFNVMLIPAGFFGYRAWKKWVKRNLPDPVVEPAAEPSTPLQQATQNESDSPNNAARPTTDPDLSTITSDTDASKGQATTEPNDLDKLLGDKGDEIAEIPDDLLSIDIADEGTEQAAETPSDESVVLEDKD